MNDVAQFPLPIRCNTVEDALAAAKQQNFDNIVICTETDDGFILLHSDKSEPLTAAKIVWILEGCKMMILQPGNEMDRPKRAS